MSSKLLYRKHFLCLVHLNPSQLRVDTRVRACAREHIHNIIFPHRWAFLFLSHLSCSACQFNHSSSWKKKRRKLENHRKKNRWWESIIKNEEDKWKRTNIRMDGEESKGIRKAIRWELWGEKSGKLLVSF